MLFPTIDFAIFFVVVFTVNWLTMPHPRVWRLFMLAASYVFYGWWNWAFVPLLIGSQVANQIFAVAISRAKDQRRRRWLLAGGVAANLGLLGTFKYYGFFASSVVNGLHRLGLEASLPLVQFVLPVGISFFTFQALSYVVDVYRGHTEPAPALDFAVYLSFFPQLVAGPIVRPKELLPQFRTPRDPRRVDSARGFYLVFIGLFKKVVIADFLARTIVDPVFRVPAQHSALETIGAIYGYSVQIFCDFSAYTDIAIGVALLMGFTFPDNFNSPYAAVSAQDFWRRWHMTLSRWLRDYVYIPFGGNRSDRRAVIYRNIMLTMLLGGLWHGAAWTFVLWGGLHGLWLVIGRWWADRRRAPAMAGNRPLIAGGAVEAESGWTRLRRQLVTFHLVTALWIIFRAESLGQAGELVSRLWTGWGGGMALLTPAVVLAIAFGVGIQYLPEGAIERIQAAFSHLRPVGQGVVLALLFLVIDALGPEGVAAFIYYQF